MKRLSIIACGLLVAACSSSTSDPGPGAPQATPADGGAEAGPTASTPKPHGVLVIGPLAKADPAEAKAQHDGLASGGEAQAKAAGDIGHAALVSTTRLGTAPNQLLAFDRWSSNDNLDAFYANPDFSAAFGQLFSAPPERGVYALRGEWAGWGALDHAPGRFWVAVRGVLKEKDPAKAQAAHDQVARGGEANAKAAGDLAHVVYIGRDDPSRFLAFDVWPDADALEKFYSNPQVREGFASLFEAPPAVGVFETGTFHQW